jgi:hypothetical protein
VARQITAALFAELPTTRRRGVISAAAHYIAGVLDHESMAQIVNELSEAANFQVGDRVKTLRGSMHGTIVRVLSDGRVVWRADSGPELIALPESLIREQKK